MTLFLLFNHNLTQAQESDAREGLGVRKIVAPPQNLQTLWSNLPPELENLRDVLAPIREWLASKARPDDIVLIQGDFGACWLMVEHARSMGLRAVYSTTRREAVEERLDDGSVRLVHTFRHVRFRQYGA